jgi:hypothetical protein
MLYTPVKKGIMNDSNILVLFQPKQKIVSCVYTKKIAAHVFFMSVIGEFRDTYLFDQNIYVHPFSSFCLPAPTTTPPPTRHERHDMTESECRSSVPPVNEWHRR